MVLLSLFAIDSLAIVSPGPNILLVVHMQPRTETGVARC
jgi:hypothetical protein